MLQEYLNNNLITISDDGNFDKLKKASDDLSKKLTKAKSKVWSYTLIALDPNISPENSGVLEVKELIIKYWSTFISNVADTPMTYIRAVIFEALKTVASDINVAGIIWYGGQNVFRYYKLVKEEKVIAAFLTTLGDRVEVEARTIWSMSNFNKLAISTAGIKDTSLTAEDLNATHLEVRQAFKKAEDYINQDLIQRVGLQNRIQLLWWKESLYSNSFNAGYPELPEIVVQSAFATDFAALVPSIYPKSADYFFKYAQSHITDTDKTLSMLDILKIVKSHSDVLKSVFAEQSSDEERLSLLQFITALIWGKLDDTQFHHFTGLESTIEIKLVDFSLWIFHERQTLKLTNNR